MVELMTDDRLEALLAGIQHRIVASEARRRRRNRLAVTLGGAAACVAITGGALAVAEASDAEKTVSICYQAATPQSQAAEVGAASLDGAVTALPDIDTRVALAEAQCEAVWQVGVLESSSQAAGTAPPLFTCLLADGRLGVFPVDDAADCDALDLRRP